MKRILAFLLAALMLAALCGCGGGSPAPASSAPAGPASADPAPASSEPAGQETDAPAVTTGLPGSFEIAATDPHYIIAIPGWHAEGYGCGFALTEQGSKDYAIVVACGYGGEEGTLEEVFSTLYNDTFNGILMQNYRAKYAQLDPASTEVTLADGSAALRFEDVQPADDYGTELNCPVYGYGFRCNDTPFIVAAIVINESAVDDAKRAEMNGYVDEMVDTVRAAG